MSITQSSAYLKKSNPLAFSMAGLLLAGFAVSVMIRVNIGGKGVAGSATAGLVFAFCLCALCLVSGLKIKFSRLALITGIVGGLLLCVVPILASNIAMHPYGSYYSWAIVVSVVALAEEAFLRGVLFDAIQKWKGETAAILIAAVAFSLLHLPLYGWRAVPLDFAVGIWLGALRAISGSWIAPGIAHVIADLASWWI